MRSSASYVVRSGPFSPSIPFSGRRLSKDLFQADRMKLQFAIVRIDAVELAINLSQLAPGTAGHMGMVEEALDHGLNSIFCGFSRRLFRRPPPTTDFVAAGCQITIALAIAPVKGIIIALSPHGGAARRKSV